MDNKVTRGHGLLEKFLSKLRSNIANKKISDLLRSGKILDIGCGFYPYFLINTKFNEKYGLDQFIDDEYIDSFRYHNIEFTNLNIEKNQKIPFEDNFFSAVTMLAVVEHLPGEDFEKLLEEIHRVLKPGGIVFITTPAQWTGGLLSFLAKLGLISKDEIDDHKYSYSIKILRSFFQDAGFSDKNIRSGYFELGANIWLSAIE